MPDVQHRINSTLSRVDQVLAEQTRREIERLTAEDAAQARADAEQAKADALRRMEVAEKYDAAFAAFGERCPQPAADERPGQFRKRLFENLRRRLPDGHEWASTRADDIPPSARATIEAMVISAAKAEGLKPSPENLPRDGSLIKRERTDAMTGAKEIHWLGRESYIKQMSRGGQRVLRIINPKTGAILMGEPMPKAW